MFSFIIIFNNNSAIYRKRYRASGCLRVVVVQATKILFVFLFLVCVF